MRIDSGVAAGMFCSYCADALLGFNHVIQLKDALKRNRKPSLECPFCKSNSDDLLSSGLAGCPLCYEAFPDVWKKLGIGVAR